MNRPAGGAATVRATNAAEDEGSEVDQDFAAARDEAADACELLASLARNSPASPEMAAACGRALQAVGVLSALTNLLVRVPIHR